MHRLRLLNSLLLILLVLIPGVQAQTGDMPPGSIEVVGIIDSLDGATMVVNGLTVDLTAIDAGVIGQLAPGVQVRVAGTLRNGLLIATLVELVNPEDPGSPALIDVEALISIDAGATWQDADDAPGVEVPVGAAVSFRLMVTNAGRVPLTNVVLLNTEYTITGCLLPAELAVSASFECTLGPFTAEAGQRSHTTTVLAETPDEQIGDTDPVYYFGGDRPGVDIENYVSTDNAAWNDADSAPGLEVNAGESVYFRYVVSNTGNVPLTGISLSGSTPGLAACSFPATLEPGATFECLAGPITLSGGDDDDDDADDGGGWYNDTTTVTAQYLSVTVADTDRVIYYTGEEVDDDPVIVIIEGPVTNINVNIITIYDIDIVVNVNDPILINLQIGDVVRVEGEMDEDDDGNVIIIVIQITIVNVIIIDLPGIPSNCRIIGNGKFLKCDKQPPVPNDHDNDDDDD